MIQKRLKIIIKLIMVVKKVKIGAKMTYNYFKTKK